MRNRPSWVSLAWVGVWTFPLLEPAAAVRNPVAGVGLAAFAVLYTVVSWAAYEFGGPSRFTVAGFAVIAPLGLALVLVNGGHWLIVLLFVATTGVAIWGGEERWKPAVVGVAVLAAIFVVGFTGPHDSGAVLSIAVSTVLASGLVFVVRQMGALIGQLRRSRQALAEAAVAEERLRFSRDLHDLLGHTLSLIVVKAEVVRRLADRDPAAAAAQAADIEDVGRRALVEIREAVTGYRETGLTAELNRARGALTTAGITATVRRATDPMPAAAENLFAWVIREAVTNVVRHSGASTCDIEIATSDGMVSLTVTDDGSFTGDLPAGLGNGLRGLAERLAAAGGSLRAGPGERGGFVLLARVPAS